MRFPGQASWIELNAAAVRRNVATFRGLPVTGKAPRIAAVVKANAYGHGLAEMLPLVHPQVDVLDVITPQDALAIRDFEKSTGRSPRQVVVLGPATPEESVELARAGVDLVLADESWPALVAALRRERVGRQLRAHVHLDTGLGREGFLPSELERLCAGLEPAADVLEIAGVLSHFSNTEDVTEQTYAESQLAAFDRGFDLLRTRLHLSPTVERHFAASAATLVLPRSRFDVVRMGIALYGLWPSAETRISARLVLDTVPPLEPVLSWRCGSQTVKRLPAGSYVGYGCTYRCPQDTTIAVLPVGYFDGYPRLLSSRSHALVNGMRCPVLGRVMMNHVVIDITRTGISDGPITATLLGREGDEAVSAELLAEWSQTINYEIVARLGAHLRRIVV